MHISMLTNKVFQSEKTGARGGAPETVKERGNRRDSLGELERQRRRERGSTRGRLQGAVGGGGGGGRKRPRLRGIEEA